MWKTFWHCSVTRDGRGPAAEFSQVITVKYLLGMMVWLQSVSHWTWKASKLTHSQWYIAYILPSKGLWRWCIQNPSSPRIPTVTCVALPFFYLRMVDDMPACNSTFWQLAFEPRQTWGRLGLRQHRCFPPWNWYININSILFYFCLSVISLSCAWCSQGRLGLRQSTKILPFLNLSHPHRI